MKLPLWPLYGLASGIILWGATRFAWVLGSQWLALLLLGLALLLNGGRWLHGVLLLGRGRGALVIGSTYIALHYLCFLFLARLNAPWAVYVAAAVAGRWVYVWGVYDFAALAPATLRQGLSKQGFALASITGLALVMACAVRLPALWPSLLLVLLFAWLFYRARRRFLGALDEAAYGATAAWGEILLYLAYFMFGLWL